MIRIKKKNRLRRNCCQRGRHEKFMLISTVFMLTSTKLQRASVSQSVLPVDCMEIYCYGWSIC